MKKYFAMFFVVLAVGVVRAESIEIKNNGAQSTNSVQVNSDDSTTVKQGSSIEINNTIDAKASTGGNNASGNSGNTIIKTGDATVSVNVVNNGNTNTVGKPTITPTIAIPTATLTPSGKPSDPSSSSGNNSSNQVNDTQENDRGEAEQPAIGGAEVKGLAATSSIDGLSVVTSIAGFICLFIGSALVSKRNS